MSEPTFSNVPVVLFAGELNFQHGLLTIDHFITGCSFFTVVTLSESVIYGRWLKLQLITQVLNDGQNWEDFDKINFNIRAEESIKKIITDTAVTSEFLRKYFKIQTNDYINQLKITAYP